MEKETCRIDLKIEGMTCATCAQNIEKALKKEPHVLKVSVNYAADKAYVEADKDKVDVGGLIRRIEDLGYQARHEEVYSYTKETFSVIGMTCTACAMRIERTLQKKTGVRSAAVNFPAEKLTVEYDANSLSVDELQRWVTDAGYSLLLDESKEEMEDEDEAKMMKAKRTMQRSGLFTGAVMGLMMIHMLVTPIPGYLLITALLALPNIFIVGYHVHRASFLAIKSKSPNMDVLVSLGSAPPYLLGLLGFFIPVTTFIEMATTIMTFHLIGKYLEVRAKGRASQAIKKLIQLGAKTARIIVDSEEREVPAKALRVGDIMVIRPGEKIPTDGIVKEGSSLVDESMATGESMPVRREAGSEVIGATLNKQGFLKVEVTKVGKDTFLAQVIKLVEECQGSKVPIQEFADRITGYFVPAILVLTGLTFLSFNLFPDFHQSILTWGAGFLPWVNPGQDPLMLSFITATAVLVIACPCALGLGTPTALMVGSGIGAEKGILIRSGEAVQTLKDVKAIAFDKTGTLTKGIPEVTDLIPAASIPEDDLLRDAAALEKASEHPLGHAIVEYAQLKGIPLREVQDFESITGKGVSGRVDGRQVLVGNRKLMTEQGISYLAFESELIRLEEEAKTAMIVAREGDVIGILAVADPIKEEAAAAVAELEAMGIQAAMITGDNRRTAEAIGRKAGIRHVIADVLPDGKVEEVVKLQQQYGMVAMVGDGINDAPALKQANVGIAIGTGTDIAIEAAEVTLVRGELGGIITAVKLSRGTFRKIKENYFWAWFYNAIAIPIAMLGLLHPMIGAAAMSLSSLNVVYNSLRLKRVDIEPSFQQQSKGAQ